MWLAFVLACTSAPDSSAPPEPVATVKGKKKSKRKVREQQGNALNDTEDPEPDEGLWNRARPASLSDEIAALEAIGYVGGTEEASAKVGVTVNEPTAHQGLNFYVSGHGPEATLMTMDGTVLHTWSKTYDEAFPWGEKYSNKHGTQFWRRAYVYPNGDLLGIYEGHGLVKLDKDSKILWTWDGRPHHDLEVLEDGNIWVLAREAHRMPRLHPRRAVLEDFAVLLDPNGKEIRRISLIEALEASNAKPILHGGKKKFGDVFHTNSLEVLDGTAEIHNPNFKAGNLLVSMRTINTIAVVDPEQKKVVWHRRGKFKRQHDPKVLSNGHLLLFDNMGGAGTKSAVREFELRRFQQVWVYANSDETPFFSRFTGVASRFDNGNTLIAESGYGRVFEITPAREVVWEFHNPNRAGDDGQFVAIIPDLVRLPADYPKWLTP